MSTLHVLVAVLLLQSCRPSSGKRDDFSFPDVIISAASTIDDSNISYFSPPTVASTLCPRPAAESSGSPSQPDCSHDRQSLDEAGRDTWYFVDAVRWLADSAGFRYRAAASSEKRWPAFEFDTQVLAATGLSLVCAALANAAGVGGGGLFVPMFNLLLGYDAKSSAALSKSMVLGGAIASVIFNIQLKHPTQDRSLIDYDIALLLQPCLLLGISTGVVLNTMAPAWAVMALLTIVLAFIFVRTLRKGISTHGEEARAAAMQKLGLPLPASLSGSSASLLSEPLLPEKDAPPKAAGVEEAVGGGAADKSFWRRVDWKVVGELALVWVAYLAIQLLKFYVPNCSGVYWALTFAQVPVSFAITAVGAMRLLKQGHELVADEEGDCSCREGPRGAASLGGGRVAVYPVYALLAGVVGGLLGIGGGMILGPVLLDLGMPPQVTTATSTFVVLFSSSMSVIEFYLVGRLPLAPALFFGALAMAAALAGLSVVRGLVRRSGRASIVIFLLAAIIGTSTLVELVLGSHEILLSYRRGEYMGFQDLCAA